MDLIILVLLAVHGVLIRAECHEPCSDGWTRFEGSCYLIGYHQQLSFIEAEAHKMVLKAIEHQNSEHLLTVKNSLRSWHYFTTFCTENKVYSSWIGLSDMDTEGLWRWYDNDEHVSFTYWYPGQPNPGDKGSNEDCAVYIDWDHDKAYNWQDYPCDSQFKPICEKNPCKDELGSIVG